MLALVAGALPLFADYTLGYSAIGGSNIAHSAGYILASGPFTASANGNVVTMQFYCSGAGNVVLSVFGNTNTGPHAPDDDPYALLGQSTEQAGFCSGGPGWQIASVILAQAIIAGTKYWASEDDNDTGSITIYYDAAPGRGRLASHTYSATMPDIFPTPLIFNVDFSIYADVQSEILGNGTANRSLRRASR